MRMPTRLLAALLALGAACGGHDVPDGGSADAMTTADATSGPDGGGTACDLAVAGSCQCQRSSNFSDCNRSARACIDVEGPRGTAFVAMSGESSCGVYGGTWSAGACPRQGLLGGCRRVNGRSGGCPINYTNWYYADPAADVSTAADVQRICQSTDQEFVAP